jgi:hypothetical protein
MESDPVGLFSGANTWSYAMDSPIRYVDPTGLVITIVINNNEAVTGTHAGFYVGARPPSIYDPVGRLPSTLAYGLRQIQRQQAAKSAGGGGGW